jgi:hypothetical protein
MAIRACGPLQHPGHPDWVTGKAIRKGFLKEGGLRRPLLTGRIQEDQEKATISGEASWLIKGVSLHDQADLTLNP